MGKISADYSAEGALRRLVCGLGLVLALQPSRAAPSVGRLEACHIAGPRGSSKLPTAIPPGSPSGPVFHTFCVARVFVAGAVGRDGIRVALPGAYEETRVSAGYMAAQTHLVAAQEDSGKEEPDLEVAGGRRASTISTYCFLSWLFSAESPTLAARGFVEKPWEAQPRLAAGEGPAVHRARQSGVHPAPGPAADVVAVASSVAAFRDSLAGRT